MPKSTSKICFATLAAIAVISPSAATGTDDIPAALQARIDAARSECASFDSGEFAVEDDAVQRVDLDGDGQEDWVVNEGRFACSSAASLYGGTGGSMSHFLIDDVVASILNQGWQLTQFGSNTVVLAQVHGSQCDGINPTPCVVSSVWDKEAKVWRTTSAVWQ